MANELLTLLLRTTCVGSLAILAMLALRLPVRRAFGCGVAYCAWLVVPLCMAASLIPASMAPALTPAFVAAARPLTQAVRYGVWVFVGVLGLLFLSWWGWWNAAAVRDQRERSAWLWRETMQTNPTYTASVTARWRQDSVKFQEETLRLEERQRLLLVAQRKRAEAVVLEKEATSKKAK